jgi:adenylate cyclase
MCSLSERSDSRPLGDALLGGPPRYRKAEIAQAAGVDLARAERLWQALGFAHVDDDAVVFTDADVAALRSFAQLASAEIIRPEQETAMTRAVGQTMARLAEWDVAIVKSVLGPAFSADVETTAQFVQEITPVMARMMEYVWRRHLAATVDRELDAAAGDERTLVVGFADIVGYTRLIRNFTQVELDGLLEEFEDLANAVIAENYGRLIKTVGDEVLFVADSATDGAEIALTLNERISDSDRLPPLRIGVARGSVLARFGDVYGSTVNVASRLTSVARPASVLVDRELAAALREQPRYHLVALGPRKVQGFSGLRAWALRRSQ